MSAWAYWDSHLHAHPFEPDRWAEALVANMSANHVRAGAISNVALFSETSDADVQRLCRAYPGRLLPMLSHVDLNDPGELARVTRELDAGDWAGVGELFLEAHQSRALSFEREGRVVKQPYPLPRDGAENRVLNGLIEYCTDKNLPVLIHCEDVAPLEVLLNRHSHSTILWAHCDFVTPLPDVRRILEIYDWLMVDFGPMIRCGYWDTEQGTSDWLHTDRDFWRGLCTKFSARMLLGTDTLGPKYADPARYRHIYDSYADFFAPLDESAVRALAGGNFQKVFAAYLRRHAEFAAG